MSAVLGISGHYHDAAAALVVDGRVVRAIQEERLSGLKNDPGLPMRAARACLGEMPAAALDAVVFYESPYAKVERVLDTAVRGFPFALTAFARAAASQLGSKLWVLDSLAERLGVPRARVEHVAHHESHAASAFFSSAFARAAVLTVDGVGETETGAIHLGEGTTLRKLESFAFPCSLGLVYAGLTAFLGFEVNDGEHQVMGLAAFGTPRFADELAKIVRLHDDGTFEIATEYFDGFRDADRAFGRKLEALLGPARPYGLPWELEGERDRRYADIAASLQARLESAMVALAQRARALTGASALCLAGGVALNAVANARIAREAGFGDVFVQPAAGDAGGALGAAILGAIARGDGRPSPMETAALGLRLDVDRAAEIARALGLRVELVDPTKEAARRIAEGQVIAFAEGAFEWGPRALGHRSILASPAKAATRERVNRLVKHREPFRPFAPAVLEASYAGYFSGAPSAMTRFMTTVATTRDPSTLEAVTHIDGTARVQSVDRETPFGALLAEVEARTGVPVVLNTSLNGRGEPIAGTAEHVLSFFTRHSLDALVLDDLLIQKSV